MTMRIGILGINHKLANLKLREKFAITCQKLFSPFSHLREHHPFVLLSTCNRTEIYFSSQDLASTHSLFLQHLKEEIAEDFEQKLYSFFSQDCFLHLCKVTAGLDSAIFAETEIQGQVKQAYESTLFQNKLPHPLHFLFQKSLKIAKEVRASFFFDGKKGGIEQTIFEFGNTLFGSAKSPSILIVGASQINLKVLEHLKKRNCEDITLCNRTMEKGEKLSAKYGVKPASWESLNQWHDYDWIILGTKAPQYLIKNEYLDSDFSSKKLVIDLGLPRNADPSIVCDPRIELLNIDQINQMVQASRSHFEAKIEQAEESIAKAVNRQASLFQMKTASPLIQNII